MLSRPNGLKSCFVASEIKTKLNKKKFVAAFLSKPKILQSKKCNKNIMMEVLRIIKKKDFNCTHTYIIIQTQQVHDNDATYRNFVLFMLRKSFLIVYRKSKIIIIIMLDSLLQEISLMTVMNRVLNRNIQKYSCGCLTLAYKFLPMEPDCPLALQPQGF